MCEGKIIMETGLCQILSGEVGITAVLLELQIF